MNNSSYNLLNIHWYGRDVEMSVDIYPPNLSVGESVYIPFKQSGTRRGYFNFSLANSAVNLRVEQLLLIGEADSKTFIITNNTLVQNRDNIFERGSLASFVVE